MLKPDFVSNCQAKLLLVALFMVVFPASGWAHGSAGSNGFFSGFVHPVAGWDHVAAMVAVGLWGAILRAPAIWILPIAFPFMMVIGAIMGMAGVPLPFVEIGIALSAVLLGLLILFYVKLPLVGAMVIVAMFAIFHGFAHGAELPEAVNPVGYAGGFVLATGLLHVAGIVLGLLNKLPNGEVLMRASGGLIALAGLGFLFGLL